MEERGFSGIEIKHILVAVGDKVGNKVGLRDGLFTSGFDVDVVGFWVGDKEGEIVGLSDGLFTGLDVGFRVGLVILTTIINLKKIGFLPIQNVPQNVYLGP